MLERMVKGCSLAASIAALVLALPSGASGHDIPNDVLVQAFLKPEGNHLNLLVRAPLKAMRDVEFPERGQGYLDLSRVDPPLSDAAILWISNFIDLYEGDTKLLGPRVVATRIALESDKSFSSYSQALAHMTGPKLPPNTDVFWNQVNLDVLFEYPIQSEQSRFAINPDGLWRLGVHVITALRLVEPNGVVRAFEFVDEPGVVRLDPQWYQAALRFVHLGFLHILSGTDHLLFLFCLVIPFRRFRALIPVVTSFTVAHSITLIAYAYNLAPDVLWFPPLIETLIACSIVYMALENIVGGTTVHRRWIITFGFGLVHGFGFSFALRETMQFAGSHMLASLLSFNVGVELGQLLVLVLLIPALELLFRFVVSERMGTVILSALICHTAWHWMMDRGERLAQYRFQWPEINAALLATALRWLMVVVILIALAWLASVIFPARFGGRAQQKAPPEAPPA